MIKKVSLKDSKLVAELALLLWPDNTLEELENEIKEDIDSDNSVVFLAYEDTHHIGFAQCQLRNDYVEGTESSS